MLFTQLVNLVRAQAGVTEHAALAEQVAKVTPRHLGRQEAVQGVAHRGNALTHGRQLSLPHRPQVGIAQHMGHDAGGMQAGAGIQAPHGKAPLAHHQRRFGGAAAHGGQGAAALTVNAHAFGERIGDEKRDARFSQQAHRLGVFVDAVAKALVGQIQVGQQLALAQDRDQRIPLCGVQIHAGGVVAAGMQQHDAARGQMAQAVQHGLKAQTTGGRVVVRVAADGDAAALEHGAVVVPGRVADPDTGLGQPGFEKIRPHLQAA